jgi:ABC-type transport system involved in cytochrome bd biosynthesis fused ATPase/permease subunit
MFVLCAVVCSVLAFLAMGMGAAQLNRVPQAIGVMEQVGAKHLAPVSGWLLLAAAAGLVIGLFWAPIGIAAAAGLVAYFLIAAALHIRVKDPIGQIFNPLVPAAIAAAALALRITTA